MKRLRNNRGYTIIEMLVAVLITGILASAGFEFYISMHNQTLAQEEISDMQQASRASLQEITKNLRMAGYRVGTHPAYVINGDSLMIFYSGTQPIDTILYFLADYSTDEKAAIPGFPQSNSPRKLMKQVNSGYAEMFADYIRRVSFTAVSPSSVQVVIEVQTSMPDEDYNYNNGYRTYAAAETVNLRNVSL